MAIKKTEFVCRLRQITERPSMFLSDPSYDGLCCFIEGCDYACDGKVLEALRRWLEKKRVPKNLAWSSAFLYSVFKSAKDPVAKAKESAANEKLAMRRLVEVFESLFGPDR